jgi:hypothetical protein
MDQVLAQFKVRYADEPLDKVAVQSIGPQVKFCTDIASKTHFSLLNFNLQAILQHKNTLLLLDRSSCSPSPPRTSSRTTWSTSLIQAT